MKVQRLRVTFTRGSELQYITHLDLMRFWERVLRRADVPIAYSEGFSPHAQISLAAPLAVGTTSEAELMDVFLAERMTPRAFLQTVSAQLPAGVEVRSVQEVALSLPALQAAVLFAEYVVDVGAPAARDDGEDRGWRMDDGGDAHPTSNIEPPRSAAGEGSDLIERARGAVAAFLAAEAVPWEHRREDEVRSYDIRALVADMRVEGATADGGLRLWMRLKNDNSGSGRPEQVVAALGLPAPVRIHRTALVLAETSPARQAWRARGRFAS